MDIETFPFMTWTFPKFHTCKYLCRDLYFLDSAWVLELAKSPDCNSDRIRITLSKSIVSPQWRLPKMAFQVQTCVLASSKSKRFVKTTIFTRGFRYSKRLIWSEMEQNINASKGSVTFCIMIMPVAAWAWTDLPSYFVERGDSLVSEHSDVPDCMLNLRNDFGQLFCNGEHSDVVLKCNGKSFRAHKAILSARSEFFAAMFRNNMKESQQSVVELKNIEPAILKILICYLYTGNLPDLSNGSLRKLYAAADMYVVESLKVKCAFLAMDSYKVDAENKSGGIENKAPVKERPDVEFVRLGGTGKKDKKLLKKLFKTPEWEALSPKLVHDMCKFLLLDRDM